MFSSHQAVESFYLRNETLCNANETLPFNCDYLPSTGNQTDSTESGCIPKIDPNVQPKTVDADLFTENQLLIKCIIKKMPQSIHIFKKTNVVRKEMQ